MKYIGTIYGKVNRKYLPLAMTSEEVDTAIKQRDEAINALNRICVQGVSDQHKNPQEMLNEKIDIARSALLRINEIGV